MTQVIPSIWRSVGDCFSRGYLLRIQSGFGKSFFNTTKTHKVHASRAAMFIGRIVASKNLPITTAIENPHSKPWAMGRPTTSSFQRHQEAVWKRARSNFSDSPRHLEVSVAELQLKKVIFLELWAETSAGSGTPFLTPQKTRWFPKG